MPSYRITLIGGDLRQCYLAEYLHFLGHIVTCYNTMSFNYKPKIKIAESLEQALFEAELIIGPVPFKEELTFYKMLNQNQILAGGLLPESLKQFCNLNNIKYIDFMSSKSFTLHNAWLTAEGLLAKLIMETPFSLNNLPILILGYGNCGFMIGEALKGVHGDVSVFDKDETRISFAKAMQMNVIRAHELPLLLSNYSVIINTIPSHILTEYQLNNLNQECFIFDIASAPFGFSKETLDKLQINSFFCPGIPGKNMPKSAGKLIGETILNEIEIERMLSHEL